MKKNLTAIMLAVFMLSVISAQTKRLPADQSFLDDFVSKHWTTSDGLPGMTVTALMQDNKGYIWIGSYDGLARFDGVEFTVFCRAVDEKYDFTSARSIIQDSHGNIWVGHNDEGISCITPEGEVIKYTADDGLPNNKINALCEDHENNIWVGTSTGLCYITPDREILFPRRLFELDQGKILVAKMYCDTEGKVWILTGIENDNLIYSNGILEQFTGITSIKNPSIYEVMQDRSGAFWFGVSPHYVVRIKDGVETVFDIGHEGLDGTLVDSIIEDSAGNYWIGSDSGLTVIHGDSCTYYDMRHGLADNTITNILEDGEGNIWFGFNRSGLQKLSKGMFRSVRMPCSVNAICEDKGRGVTWIGTDNGVYCYKDNQFIENSITKLCKNLRVRHAAMTKDGELLISSYSEMPFIRVLPNDELEIWTVQDGIVTTKCRVAMKTSLGDYYVGTPQGLSIIHHKDGHVSTLTRADGFSNHYIMWLYEDSRGRLWAGTNGDGVFILKDEKIIKHFSTEEGLSGNVIFKILEIEDGLWIATGAGLSKYNEEDDTFINFDSKNGFGADSVFQMICDSSGTVWMTSNKGVFSTPFSEIEEVVAGKRKKLSIRSYGASNGLLTSGVTATSLSAMDSEGRVWFTLTDGFAIYDPAKVPQNHVAPKVEVQEYSIDNTKYEYHGEKIVLEPSVKRLNIKFTGISFSSSDNLIFCYKLNGFENDFSDWAAARNVSYTNLKPGTYSFIVMSQNSDEIQGELSPPVTIIKLPYLWQRWWFWPLLAIFLLLCIVLSARHKIRSMRRYQIELEQKVKERTRDLKLANEKAEGLLLNILPANIAAELSEHPNSRIAKKYLNASVLFTDIVGFTKMSDGMSAEEVVDLLNELTSRFDERAEQDGIEKIKTIGDAYMAACGLTEQPQLSDAAKMIRFAQNLLEEVRIFNERHGANIQIRIGINTGNLVAGVIGKSKFIYDIWGDTVNVASRMESTGKAMKIHVSETTYEQTKDAFAYSEEATVIVKGKGEMRTYFL